MSTLDQLQLGFMGAGNMVSAIVHGLVNSGIDPRQIYLTDNSGNSAPQLAEQIGAHYRADSATLVKTSDVLILGMKPHQLNDALAPVQSQIEQSQPLIISLAAGRSTESLEKILPEGARVVRIMPNVAARVGLSTTGICGGKAATQQDLEITQALCAGFGTGQLVPESLFPAFTALAGCSPAWLAASVDALAQAGVAQGLSKKQALAAAAGALEGTGRLIQESLAQGKTAADVIDQVCSPSGTTVAGLLAAENRGLRPVWQAAVQAAVARDAHLSQN